MARRVARSAQEGWGKIVVGWEPDRNIQNMPWDECVLKDFQVGTLVKGQKIPKDEAYSDEDCFDEPLSFYGTNTNGIVNCHLCNFHVEHPRYHCAAETSNGWDYNERLREDDLYQILCREGRTVYDVRMMLDVCRYIDPPPRAEIPPCGVSHISRGHIAQPGVWETDDIYEGSEDDSCDGRPLASSPEHRSDSESSVPSSDGAPSSSSREHSNE
jgi:hypothetical protein